MRNFIGFVAACLLAPAAAFAQPADAPPAATPPPPERFDDGALKAWADDNLDQEGWIYYGFTTPQKMAVIWYVAEQSLPGSKYPLMREWIRSENAKEPGSRLARVELDCEKRQLRDLDDVFYAGNNMRGRITATNDTADSPWLPIAKGSVGETLMQRVCREAR